MLETWELADMRTQLDRTLPGTAVLSSPTETADGRGGWTKAYAAYGTASARLSPDQTRSGEQIVGDRVAEVTRWILTLPAHQTIDESDRVEFNGRTFEVSEVQDRVPWEISTRVRLVEVD